MPSLDDALSKKLREVLVGASEMSNMLSRDESVEQLDFALKSAGMGVYSCE